jgi:hypothetical protein
MNDWKKVSEGYGYAIPQEQLEKAGPVLDTLLKVFRPLSRRVPHLTEPAVIFGFHSQESE